MLASRSSGERIVLGEGGPGVGFLGIFKPQASSMTRNGQANRSGRRRQQRRIRRRCWEAALDLLVEHGFGGLARAVEILVNEAMLIERAAALEAAPYERSPRRRGYATLAERSFLEAALGRITCSNFGTLLSELRHCFDTMPGVGEGRGSQPSQWMSTNIAALTLSLRVGQRDRIKGFLNQFLVPVYFLFAVPMPGSMLEFPREVPANERRFHLARA
jgi:hypothetical protein